MPPAAPGTALRWRRPTRILLWVFLTLIGLLLLVLAILPSLVSLERVRQQLVANGTLFLLGPLANSLGRRAAFLQDSTGRTRLPFAVQGTLTRPQVIPNEQRFLDLAKQSLGGTMGQHIGEELKRRLGDRPQGATPNPSEGKPGSRPDTREKPSEPLERTLTGLLGR